MGGFMSVSFSVPDWKSIGFLLCMAWAVATPAVAEPDAETASLLDLEARRLSGPVERLDRYRGEVLLVVNTASRCGFTPQYEGLQSLYDRYVARARRAAPSTARRRRTEAAVDGIAGRTVRMAAAARGNAGEIADE
jgi:hypothetical protein